MISTKGATVLAEIRSNFALKFFLLNGRRSGDMRADISGLDMYADDI